MDTEEVKKTVELTQDELEALAAIRAKKAKEEADQKKAEDLEAYKALVDETVIDVFPKLRALSEQLGVEKQHCYSSFHKALAMKADLFNIKSDQKSHTFTNKESTMRIVLGQYETDGYDDTVNEGIAKVKDFMGTLAKDQESSMMVKGLLRLLSRDSKGNLKASRIMQLKQMADESGNEMFKEGVTIIEKSYRPEVSKYYVKAEYKDENGSWVNVPLGITEA
jgi:hypothetical protein